MNDEYIPSAVGLNGMASASRAFETGHIKSLPVISFRNHAAIVFRDDFKEIRNNSLKKKKKAKDRHCDSWDGWSNKQVAAAHQPRLTSPEFSITAPQENINTAFYIRLLNLLY